MSNSKEVPNYLQQLRKVLADFTPEKLAQLPEYRVAPVDLPPDGASPFAPLTAQEAAKLSAIPLDELLATYRAQKELLFAITYGHNVLPTAEQHELMRTQHYLRREISKRRGQPDFY